MARTPYPTDLTDAQWEHIKPLIPDSEPGAWPRRVDMREVIDGTWVKVHDRLRERVRRKAGKKPTPTAAVIDSQSVKTAEKGGAVGTTRARRLRHRLR